MAWRGGGVDEFPGLQERKVDLCPVLPKVLGFEQGIVGIGVDPAGVESVLQGIVGLAGGGQEDRRRGA